MLIVPASR
nr:TPA_asm: M112 uORF 2 RNA *1 [Murid betaherpesvirus 1]DBA07884.1 TPA_asm: M112 uORF 2 RNA *1 [Murid betaherpesvirus 1]